MTPLECTVAHGVAEAAGVCLDVGQVGGGVGCAFGAPMGSVRGCGAQRVRTLQGLSTQVADHDKFDRDYNFVPGRLPR